VKDGRRFLQAMRKAATAKPVIVLKGGRTEAGTRAVHSHTGSLAGSMRVFDALLRQVGAVRADSVRRWWTRGGIPLRRLTGRPPPGGPGVAVGGGGGFSVFAADEWTRPACAPRPAGRPARPGSPTRWPAPACNPSTLSLDPAKLRETVSIVGAAENINAVMFHISFSFGGWRRSASWFDPQTYRERAVEALVDARTACGKPVVVMLRPPLDVQAMEQSVAFQELCWRADIPVFPSIPRAANAFAKLLRWRAWRQVAHPAISLTSARTGAPASPRSCAPSSAGRAGRCSAPPQPPAD
jgi:acyl-CoA synthetase (NDP forming)